MTVTEVMCAKVSAGKKVEPQLREGAGAMGGVVVWVLAAEAGGSVRKWKRD